MDLTCHPCDQKSRYGRDLRNHLIHFPHPGRSRKLRLGTYLVPTYSRLGTYLVFIITVCSSCSYCSQFTEEVTELRRDEVSHGRSQKNITAWIQSQSF